MGKKRKRKTHVVPPHMREKKDVIALNLASGLDKKRREKFLDAVEPCALTGFPPSVPYYVSRHWVLTKAYRVVGAYDSPAKRKRSKKRKGRGRTERAYHGTAFQNIASIVASQFKLPNHYGMFGRAIYLSPNIHKCIGYTKRGWNRRRDNDIAYILVCNVSMGNTLNASEALTDMDPERAKEQGYDTVIGFAGRTKSYGGSLRHTEYAVYDPSRIKVTHILQYTLSGV